MRLLRRCLAAGSIAACAVLAPSRAAADLTDDAARLVERWSAKWGTTVTRLAPLFLEHGRLTVVRLRGDAKPAKAACTTVVLLAPRTSEIAFLTDGEPAAPAPPPPSLPIGHPSIPGQSEGGAIRSKAGVATLERCGKEQAAHPLEDERVLVQAVSPRTAVEVLVVRSAAPIEDVESILPERAVGPSAPRGDAGRPVDPGPIAERLQRVEKRSRDDGAEHVLKVSMHASAMGSGQFTARLGEGCHALDVLAEVPQLAVRATDVDAEVRATDGGRFLGRDRGEAPDARIDFCLGEPTEVDVSFIGAAGPAAVTLVDSHWPLPAGLPSEWGPQVRGDMALALRRRHAPALPADPVASMMGVQGETMAPFEVEPGQCYLALVALVRGDARQLRLAAEIGDRAPHDEISERPEAAQVAFCATTEDRAALRVEARGAQPWWVATIWRMTK